MTAVRRDKLVIADSISTALGTGTASVCIRTDDLRRQRTVLADPSPGLADHDVLAEPQGAAVDGYQPAHHLVPQARRAGRNHQRVVTRPAESNSSEQRFPTKK